MADIVNLRAARKRKARAGKREKAAANRLLHGRDGAETQVAKLVEARTTRVHEGPPIGERRRDARRRGRVTA